MDELTAPAQLPVGEQQARKWITVLERYKSGKSISEMRVIAAEEWWRLHNASEEQDHASLRGNGYKSQSAWLHNVIVSKHADAMEAYPEPNILPREAGDRPEATKLSSIVPCVLDGADFERVWSDVTWQKLKTGTGIYKVTWDKDKFSGMGDIAIERVSLLNVFWEPGITDIQKSRMMFHTEAVDRETLMELYPELEDRIGTSTIVTSRYRQDNPQSTEDKLTLVDVYYKKLIGGRQTLQYAKIVNEVVLYATENIPEMRERGLYDHGRYPFVFDPLFPTEDSPCGYGYVDVCRSAQTTIDLLNTAMVQNAMVAATPRYFVRGDGGINEEELLDLSRPILHVTGNLGDDYVRLVEHKSLDGNTISMMERTVQELRETSGNTESANGIASSGVTAASGIAALQEAAGKTSRDSTLSAYRAFKAVVEMVIELIRQFYSIPRQFRITGEKGQEAFALYSSAGIQPKRQGESFGVEMGYRVPVFDIKVSAQRRTMYTKVAQNELALQFYNLGFFNAGNATQALATLDAMDFDGKEELRQKIAENEQKEKLLARYMQMALMYAAKCDPKSVPMIERDAMALAGGGQTGRISTEPVELETGESKEHGVVEKARAKAQEAGQPEGEV